MKNIEKFKKNIIANVSGLIAFTITDLDSGVALLSHSVVPDFDAELASSFNLEVAKAKMKAIEALGLDEKIVDILITLDNQIHIIDIAQNEEYFIYLAVDSRKINLGMTRSLLKTAKKILIG